MSKVDVGLIVLIFLALVFFVPLLAFYVLYGAGTFWIMVNKRYDTRKKIKLVLSMIFMGLLTTGVFIAGRLPLLDLSLFGI